MAAAARRARRAQISWSAGQHIVSRHVGLDTVELIMGTEELLDIDLPDEETSRVFTVGQFHSLVMKQLRERDRPNLNDSVVMDQLRTLICHHLRVEPSQVTPEARFREDLRAD